MSNSLKTAETYTHTHTHTGKSCRVKFSNFILFPILILFSAPVFATGITATSGSADPATCDTDTLGTATGPAQLRANFTPEIINLNWFDENGNQITVPTASNTCTYDTAIVLPTNPTRPGYKFKGWKVPTYDFSTLQNQIGVHHWGKGKNTLTGETDCRHAVSGTSGSSEISCTDSNFSDLQPGEWKTQFSYGMVYGIGICSSSVGNGSFLYGVPNESSDGEYCWCRATGYVPNNSSIKYIRSQVVPWVRGMGFSTAEDCHKWCPTNCAYYCDNSAAFSGRLFGVQ